MKRFALFLVLCVPATVIQAQESPTQESPTKEAHEAGEEGHLEIWKWANFLLLAGALGYLIGKNAGPFFDARSRSIRQDMEDSLRQRQEAEARAAEVDRRLASLEADIAELRGASQREAQAETDRMARQTAAEIAKIQAHAEQEIASAGKAARMELKRYSAELAIGLAEQKIRARMTPDAQDAQVQGFVRDLTRDPTRHQT
jgi:F0F1-type ATP synthase membrane subunit b/b'